MSPSSSSSSSSIRNNNSSDRILIQQPQEEQEEENNSSSHSSYENGSEENFDALLDNYDDSQFSPNNHDSQENHDDSEEEEESNMGETSEMEIETGYSLVSLLQSVIDRREEAYYQDNGIMPPGEEYSDDEDASEDTHHDFSRHLPAARQHSYLPGVSYPLFPEQWARDRNITRSIQSHQQQQNYRYIDNNDTIDIKDQNHKLSSTPDDDLNHINLNVIKIPILQVDGMVIFPGSTFPLRLYDREWIHYLGDAIQTARRLGHFYQDPYTNRTTEESGTNVPTSSSLIGQPIQIGIMTIPNEGRRRRRQLLINRLFENPSDTTQDDAGDTSNNSNNNENDNSGTSGRRRRMGRWNIELVRRGIFNSSSHIQRSTDGDEGTSSSIRNNDNEQADEGSDINDDTESRHRFVYPTTSQSQSSRNQDPLIGRVGTFATITHTNQNYVDTNVRPLYEQVNGRPVRIQPIVATAISTGRFRVLSRVNDSNQNQTNHSSSNSSNDRSFRLYNVQTLNDENLPLPSSSIVRRKYPYIPSDINVNNNYSSNNECLLEDGSILNNETKSSKSNLQESNSNPQIPTIIDPFLQHHNNIINNLSKVSSLPSFAYSYVWPWKLVQVIIMEIQSNDCFKGLGDCLPSSSGLKIRSSPSVIVSTEGGDENNIVPLPPESNTNHNEDTTTNSQTTSDSIETNMNPVYVNPSEFSFWLASNLPLSEIDKLELLETDCITARLRILYKKLLEQKQAQNVYRCKTCGSHIALASNLFTVGGAEGISGAYVNEYGCIHQTITVREIFHENVIYSGRPETKDSWFPGYAWIITSCSLCSSHLGWKFVLVGGRNPEQNRPNNFWGMSEANVTTSTTSPQRRDFAMFPRGS